MVARLPPPTRPGAPGPAYLATDGLGVVRVDEGTFSVVDTIPDQHRRYIRNLALDRSGTLFTEGVGYTYRLAAGSPTTELPKMPPGYSTDELVPAGDGTLWTWSITKVARFDGGAWSEAATSDALGQGGFMGLEIDTKGVVWLAAHKQLFKRDGAGWSGVPSTGVLAGVLFQDLIATREGAVFALVMDSLIDVTAAPPVRIKLPAGRDGFGNALATGGDGRIALVNLQGETTVYDPATKTFAAYDLGGVVLGGRDSIAMDGSGRVWVAGKAGLVVFGTDGKPTFYKAGSAPAVSATINSIVIHDAGPTLPAVGEVQFGRIKGTVQRRGGAAVATATVELCAAPAMMMRKSETPCQGQPYQRTTTTDADGGFVIDQVPLGTWGFAVRESAGATWSISRRDYCAQTKPGETCLAPIAIE